MLETKEKTSQLNMMGEKTWEILCTLIHHWVYIVESVVIVNSVTNHWQQDLFSAQLLLVVKLSNFLHLAATGLFNNFCVYMCKLVVQELAVNVAVKIIGYTYSLLLK